MARDIPTPEEQTITRRKRSVHNTRPEKTAKSDDKYTRDHMISLKLGSDLKTRLDAALDNVGPREGKRTLADMVRTAVNDYVTELENRHNDGKPFPDLR